MKKSRILIFVAIAVVLLVASVIIFVSYNKNENNNPPHTHTEVIDAAVAPTCTETGLTEGKHCSVCNTVLVAQTVVRQRDIALATGLL